MENNGIVKSIICFTLGMLIAFPVFVSAYNPETTHAALTQEAVKLFNAQYKNPLTSETDRLSIILGSIKEDDGLRMLQHFYDPVYNRGLTVAKEWQSSKEWAQDSLAQAGIADSMMAGTLKTFFSGKDDYSWERGIYEYVWGNKERGLETLGHILHLLQDASVPDHTRNDAHPPLLNFGSPYEEWADKFNKSNIDILEKVKNKPSVSLTSLEEYFDSIATFSNNNFFSKNTISNKEYNSPSIAGEVIWKKLNDGQFYQFLINNKGYLLLLTGYRKFGKVQEDKTIEDPDNLILTGYWNLLSQQAVLHGAGVIKLFFDEVEKEKETRTLYNKNKNWLQKLFDLTQKDIYQTATALYGGSVPYDELKNETEVQPQVRPAVLPVSENIPLVQPEETHAEANALAEETEAKPSDAEPKIIDSIAAIQSATDPSKPTPYQPGFGGGGGSSAAQQNNSESTQNSAENNTAGEGVATSTSAVPAPVVLSPEGDAQRIATNSLTFSGIASTTLTISNSFNGATTTPDSNENWILALEALPEGETAIQFIATNGSGMTATSSSKTITVDTEAPSVDSFTVLQCQYSLLASTCLAGGTTLNLSWTSTSSDISYVALIVDGAHAATTTGLSGTTTVSSSGAYSIQIALYDAVGHGATSTAQSVTVVTRPIVINEIAWAGTAASSFDEWIELYNPSAHDIALQNISLVADDGTPDISLVYTATSSGYYLIERTASTTTSVAEDLATPFSGSGGGSGISNDGEVLRLVHYLGGFATTTLDETPALSACSSPWCAGSDTSKQTMERVSASSSGTLSSNWRSNNTFTKNGTDANGAALNGTPRSQNSVSLLSVGYYCSPETSSYVEGSYYAPASSSQCTYLSSAISSGTRYGDLYRGTTASSTIVTGHSLGIGTSKTETDSYAGASQGDTYFTAIYHVRSGPAFNDVTDFRNFFQTGANAPPHLNYGVISWTYGVAP